MLRTHAENNPLMTRQHHANGLLSVAHLRKRGLLQAARRLLVGIKRNRIGFGHLWLDHGSATSN